LEERKHETVWWAEVVFCPGDWPKDATPLRTIVLKFEARQASLFAADGAPLDPLKYLAIVSNDDATPAPALLRWHWAKAGGIEHVHDVVKNELAGGTLPCAEFGANAAWFRLNLLTYNVLSAIKTLALPPTLADARPKRLRFVVFDVAAELLMHARVLIARVYAGVERAAALLDTRRALLR
jgi:hypothetical protein